MIGGWPCCLVMRMIGYVEQPLVRYRQHADNAVGVKYDLARATKYLLNSANWRQQVNAVRASMSQAGLLIERLQIADVHLGPGTHLDVVVKYAELDNIPRFQRLHFLTGHKICKRSKFSNLFFSSSF
ncbi:MAG: hypothetical protein WDM70_05065 [Nitrosomonadales bacterium]